MLVLSRRVTEVIVIGNDEIEITILGIKGGQVKIGVKADKNIAVNRKEIWLRLQAEKARA